MGRFEKAKKARPLILLWLALAVAAFIIFNPIFTLAVIAIGAPFSYILLCKQCSKTYLAKPFHFLWTGEGSGTCVHCGYEN